MEWRALRSGGCSRDLTVAIQANNSGGRQRQQPEMAKDGCQVPELMVMDSKLVLRGEIEVESTTIAGGERGETLAGEAKWTGLKTVERRPGALLDCRKLQYKLDRDAQIDE